MPYNPCIPQEITLQAAVEQRHTRPAGSGLQLASRPEIALAQPTVITEPALNPRERDNPLTTHDIESTASATPIMIERHCPPSGFETLFATNPQPGDTPLAATRQALSPYDHWVRTVRKLGNRIINNNRKNVAFQQSQSAAWSRGDIIPTHCPDGSVAFELTPEALQTAETAGEQASDAWRTWRGELDRLQPATETEFLQDKLGWIKTVQKLSTTLNHQNSLTVSRAASQVRKTRRWHCNGVVPTHYPDGSVAIALSPKSLELSVSATHSAISTWSHNRKQLQSAKQALESHSPSDYKPWVAEVREIARELLDKENGAEVRLEAARKYLAWRYEWGEAVTTMDANHSLIIDLPAAVHAAAAAAGMQALQHWQSQNTQPEVRQLASGIDPRFADHHSWVVLICQLNQEFTDKTEDEVRTAAVQRHQAGAWEWGEAITTIDNHGQIVFDLPPSTKKAAMAAGQQAVQTWRAQQAEFLSAWRAAASDAQFADYFAKLNTLCQQSNRIWSRIQVELLPEKTQRAPTQTLPSSATLLRSVPPLNDREAWLNLVHQLYHELSSQQESEIRATAVQKQIGVAYQRGELIHGIDANQCCRADLKFNARMAAEMAASQAVTDWQAQKALLVTAQHQLESNYPLDNNTPWVTVVQQLSQAFGSAREATLRQVATQKSKTESYEQGRMLFDNTKYDSHPVLTQAALTEAAAAGEQAVMHWRAQRIKLITPPPLLVTDYPLDHHLSWIKVVTQLSQLAWERDEAQIRASASQSHKAIAWARGEWLLSIQDRDNRRPTAALSLLASALSAAAVRAEQAAVDWLAQTAQRQEEQRPPSSDATHLNHWLDTVRQLITLLEKTTAQALREVVSQRSQAWAWEWGEVAFAMREDGRVSIDLPAQAKAAAIQAGERAVKTWQHQTAWLETAHQALSDPTAALLQQLPPLAGAAQPATDPVDIVDRLAQQMMGGASPSLSLDIKTQSGVPKPLATPHEFITPPLAA